MSTNIVTSNYTYAKNASSVKSGEYWYDDGSSSTISMDSFLSLMMAQLSNQDFNNAVDNNQFIQQMSQYAMVEAMNKMQEYSQMQFGSSLVGKDVAIYNSINNSYVYGTVEALNISGDEYKVLVNGATYELKSVVQVYPGSAEASTSTSTTDYDKMIQQLLSGISELKSSDMNSVSSSFTSTLQSLVVAIQELLETMNKEESKDENSTTIVESTSEATTDSTTTEEPFNEENAMEILSASIES